MNRKNVPVYFLDAFTSEPFKGNQIAVCPVDKDFPSEKMQKIASELNLSETAFVYPIEGNFKESSNFSLRWFTPVLEVDLCGHGTLGTSSLIFDEFKNINREIFFQTKSGTHSAINDKDWVWLNFPRFEATNYQPPEELMLALGIRDYINCVFLEKAWSILIHIDDERDIRSINPDFFKMNNMDISPASGVIITQRGDEKYDFFSRYFCPWHGINEDPVTGSAHSILAPYWQKTLNKDEMLAFQASKRGGELKLRFDNNYPERVFIGGQTVRILNGQINI
mgnify:CR=1 FL=1